MVVIGQRTVLGELRCGSWSVIGYERRARTVALLGRPTSTLSAVNMTTLCALSEFRLSFYTCSSNRALHTDVR
jgi:hypothetical protein